jgi:hypothetical protein
LEIDQAYSPLVNRGQSGPLGQRPRTWMKPFSPWSLSTAEFSPGALLGSRDPLPRRAVESLRLFPVSFLCACRPGLSFRRGKMAAKRQEKRCKLKWESKKEGRALISCRRGHTLGRRAKNQAFLIVCLGVLLFRRPLQASHLLPVKKAKGT